jgi:uracil-DNA glycosylase family 4
MAEKRKKTIKRAIAPSPRNPHCDRCGLRHEMRHNICVWGSGPETGDIMLIGIMPGIEEDRQGRPWVGAAGEYLRERLGRIGIDLDDLYSTNLLKCMTPRGRAAGGFRKRSASEIKVCAPYLVYEVEEFKPKVIVTLGSVPTQFFTGQTSVENARGGEVVLKKAGFTVIPTYNPAHFVRNTAYAIPSGEEDRFLADLQKAKAIADGTQKYTEIDVTIADTPAKAKEMLAGMEDAEEIVVDVETTGLEDYKEWSRVYCIGVCFEDGHAWVIPWDHPEHPKANKSIRNRFIELLHGKTIIGHNVKFDLRWMARLYGLDIWKVDFWDTRVAAHLLDENYPYGHPLKVLVRDWVNAPNYAFGMKWSEKKRSFIIGKKKISWEQLLEYNGMDAGYTWLLKKRLAAALEREPDLEAIANTILFPSSRAFCQMELNGIGIDERRLEESRKEIKEDIARLQEELKAEGLDVDNVSKKAVVIDWVSSIRGNLVKDKTPRKKKPSIARATLLEYAGADPAVRKLLECQELMKLLGTYLGDPEHSDPEKRNTGWGPLIHNGRLYPRYYLVGTVTGQTSCEAPNVLHVPSDRRVRGVFCAPEGWSFLQIELGTVAAAAKDEEEHQEKKSLPKAFPDISRWQRRTAVGISWAMGRLYDNGVIRGLGFEPPSERGILRPDQIRQVALIHDAMLFEVRDDCVEKYKAIIKALMGSLPLDKAGVGHSSLPTVAEVSVYKVWGDEMEKPAEPFAFVTEDADDQSAANESSDRRDPKGRKSSDPSGPSWVQETVAHIADEHGWSRTEQVAASVLGLFDLWRDEEETSGTYDEWKSEALVVKQLEMWGIQELEVLGALHIAVSHKWLEMRKYLAGREVRRQYRVRPRGGDDLDVWLRIEAGGRFGKVRLLVENAREVALAHEGDS